MSPSSAPSIDEGYNEDHYHDHDPYQALSKAIESIQTLKDIEALSSILLNSLSHLHLSHLHRLLTPHLPFDILSALPTELSLHVLSFLQWDELLAVRRVNKQWKTLSEDGGVWRLLCLDKGWSPSPPLFPFPKEKERHPEEDEGIGEEDPEYTTPTWKLIHLTHTKLLSRFRLGRYTLRTLPPSHISTIYSLQLYAYPQACGKREGQRVLFSASRDMRIVERSLPSSLSFSHHEGHGKGNEIIRVLEGSHTSSILSMHAAAGYLASAGSDRRVVLYAYSVARDVWEVTKVVQDHTDSVLCVRFVTSETGDGYLVSCSKDRTIRIYSFPEMEALWVLDDHRAAVNAVALSTSPCGQIVLASASGDRSIKLWSLPQTSESSEQPPKLLKTFELHHTRGIASLDFKFPYILSGSSDWGVRIVDVSSLFSSARPASTIARQRHLPTNTPTCTTCGNATITPPSPPPFTEGGHKDLVRTVALTEDFVVTGGYDLSVKIWDKATGNLHATLSGGHRGRIFSIVVDKDVIVSCGEDGRICVWDFATNFGDHPSEEIGRAHV